MLKSDFIRYYLTGVTLLLFPTAGVLANRPYWHLAGDAIRWTWDGRSHDDHIEMSGRQMSVVLRYGIRPDGSFWYSRGMVWPMLRTLPNDTHASLQRRMDWNPLRIVTRDRYPLDSQGEQVRDITLRNGVMTVESDFHNIHLRRQISPSVSLPALVENFTLTNTCSHPLKLTIDIYNVAQQTPATDGLDGSYRIVQEVHGAGLYQLAVGDSLSFSAITYAVKEGQGIGEWDAVTEIARRRQLVDSWQQSLILETPDTVLNRMFEFSKIRSFESIYQTKCGPLHGPGGESYYAAVWANDQAEYANPFFAMAGYDYACQSAMKSFELFASYMNDEWRPIPSSIIAEGTDYWNGAGDRGDAAMIAYGAARYALARGNREEAEALWPLIEWCLAYCRHRLNDAGVVRSDHDELEGRFPAGDANLCTSSLYYDALLSAAMLGRDLGMPNSYQRQASRLRRSIDRFFHAIVEGFDTYRYYDGNTQLRSWICIPLAMGIFDRAEGTLDALFSPRLWTENGMLTQSGEKTYWDRTTLYAFRAALMAGATERVWPYLQHFARMRLLGDHVPYAIEAWPEGHQRHLSAESALFGRVITEGLFGIRPSGLSTFTITPRLPEGWSHMTLRNVFIAGGIYDIQVARNAKNQIETNIKKHDLSTNEVR